MKSARLIGFAIPLLLCVGLFAAEQKLQVVRWSGEDTQGVKHTIPDPDRCTIVAFLRAEQKQSSDVAQILKKTLADDPGVQVLAVVSGPTAPVQARSLRELGWPIILDPDFALSGRMSVHVWPTTLVIATDGTQLAHLAGMNASLARDLRAHLDFGASRITKEQLDERLRAFQTVQDTPQQMAQRRLLVAQRLIDSGELQQARQELESALARYPETASLQLELARVLLLAGKPQEAHELLDQIAADGVPSWQLALLRVRALIDLERWDEARALLPETLRLNPEPAEGYYFAGLIHQHDRDWENAAQSFRRAFESARTKPRHR